MGHTQKSGTIQAVIKQNLPASQQELQNSAQRLQDNFTGQQEKLTRIKEVVGKLPEWAWPNGLATDSLDKLSKSLEDKTKELEMRLIPEGITLKSCEEIVFGVNGQQEDTGRTSVLLVGVLWGCFEGRV